MAAVFCIDGQAGGEGTGGLRKGGGGCSGCAVVNVGGWCRMGEGTKIYPPYQRAGLGIPWPGTGHWGHMPRCCLGRQAHGMRDNHRASTRHLGLARGLEMTWDEVA